jgi:hypothetical protein
MRRSKLIALIVLCLVAVLVASALLARVLSVDGAERSAVAALITAEARGDQNAMLDGIRGCRQSAACLARVEQDIGALRHPGAVSIIQVQPSAGFSLTSTVGTARVAWNVGGSLPRVQCVRVRRAGNALSGLRVQLLAISRRIATDGACPARF